MIAPIRRAVPADAESIAALRAMMFESMGTPAVGAEWRVAFTAWVREALDMCEVACFVADHPSAGLVSSALGQVTAQAPSPRNPTGLCGELFNVVTAADWRRNGLGRGCVESLVDWFRTSTPVGNVTLTATADGSALYRQLGFVERAYPSMRLIIDR